MSELQYPACIRELYESEILGEALALALVAAARNDRDRYHFGTLLQLETETKARLRPFLCQYGISLAEDMDLSGVAEAVAGYRQSNWQEFVAANIPMVRRFLARFVEIAAIAPARDRGISNSMVRHESAILEWLETESRGATTTSLDAIIAELQHPLPKPETM